MRPDQFKTILGTNFITKSSETVFRLQSGKAYDRYQLAAIGVPQIKAALHLNLICQRLSITTSHQLATRIGELTQYKGIGHAAFYVALAVLAHEGIVDKALNVYSEVAVSLVHHNPGRKDWEPTPVTLATLKSRKRKKKHTTKKDT